MRDDFVHLHVASSFSLRYGASPPAELVATAAAAGQGALALTDRDGLYGAVRFVQACQQSGIAPILGVDLALAPEPNHADRNHADRNHADRNRADRNRDGHNGAGASGNPGSSARRQPVKGGQPVDPRHPRVTVLARGQGAGLAPGAGWARLCRLVTATHLSGERGSPCATPESIAQHARPLGNGWRADPRARGPHEGAGSHRRRPQPGEPAPLLVLLGPDSDVGRALIPDPRGSVNAGAGAWAASGGARGPRVARELLDRWLALLPPGALAIEIVNHGGPPDSPGGAAHARRMLALATAAGIPALASAAVRHAHPEQGATVDVLDAARRLTLLHERHIDRVSTAGHLCDAPTIFAAMRRVTGEQDAVAARRLLARTGEVARECTQDPRTDIGIGSVHLPEPSALGLAPGTDCQQVLARRCREAVPSAYPGAGNARLAAVHARLDEELAVVRDLGYPTYFLTVAAVCDLIRDMGVRCAARGSGAGSMINYLLGVSGIEPLTYGLLMERFCTTLRAELPDIDVDVESARRTAVYEQILERFGGDRVTCVSMMETYRVRHAIRDVGSALGLPPVEIDAIAKAFPHIRARDARNAIAELPELAAFGVHSGRGSAGGSGLLPGGAQLEVLFELVERLDGLPRHIALHPCGVVLSDAALLDRTPVEASWLGFPMSQFDKDDVETLGLLKLDVLGIRMQSAMAHAVDEVARVTGTTVDLDDRTQLPLDDPATFDLIRSTRTLGCFQIESPGQRELIGKFAPDSFDDLVIDISLFRPGPVKSDMIRPFLEARQGWNEPDLLHPSLAYALESTCGVVVFHEQVLQIVATTAGVSLAEADEVRRAMGTHEGRDRVEAWWRPRAAARGYEPSDVERIWEVLAAFASFGFCKAHAAAFALPTYQSAWLKTHHPAAFLAGVLTHDPGMYPKRLILDDARGFGVPILPLDVNISDGSYRLERLGGEASDDDPFDAPEVVRGLEIAGGLGGGLGSAGGLGGAGCVAAADLGIRLSLADVKGVSEAELARIVAGQPYADLPDFWQRAHVCRPVAERLVLAGAFDSLYGLDGGDGLGRRGGITRRDLLLHVGELERWSASLHGRRGRRARVAMSGVRPPATRDGRPERSDSDRTDSDRDRDRGRQQERERELGIDVRRSAAAQSQAPAAVAAPEHQPMQLRLDLGDTPVVTGTGLPEMTRAERVHAELDILGLDVSGHVLDPYAPMLAQLPVVRAADLRQVRSRSEIYVAGVKVATQTPPVRSGRRVVFLTLEDSTGPADATFFEDVQGPYAATVFGSWLLLVRGVVRRTGPMGISLRATGAWELAELTREWETGGIEAVRALLTDDAAATVATDTTGDAQGGPQVGIGREARRVLVHSSGFAQSLYSDVRPAGDSSGGSGRKLWHSSPGSSGR
ncbi:error-prone DNA polymerase [Kineosphaera limosa]|uniref:DNA-directed DNA polymerase n=1 Tax=Kineosphaera limosa NBRC 100340 TaxID=1184609 RepID=K6X0D4_9MICO|nr:PHP domain-containing protein [Kineosphaera limosa]NYD99008.1 error-prone DNA polymerase [Kineosphaera limosa]GAB97787.1 error-prone DNA polymerase [Kineosphaera limosa NBRC 100340]